MAGLHAKSRELADLCKGLRRRPLEAHWVGIIKTSPPPLEIYSSIYTCQSSIFGSSPAYPPRNLSTKMDGSMTGGNFTHNNTVAPISDRVLPLFSLKGRTAIISGAGAGIGLAVAHALAEAGANVAIWYNSNKKAIAEAENIEKIYGVKCRPSLTT